MNGVGEIGLGIKGAHVKRGSGGGPNTAECAGACPVSKVGASMKKVYTKYLYALGHYIIHDLALAI